MVSIKELKKRAVVDAKTGCWIWNGRDRNKYQMFHGERVHRLAYEVAVGSIPAGLCVCHRCDTPACFNPAHLFAGTHLDNMWDSQSKGRQRGHHDENEPGRKMESLLKAYRRRKKLSQSQAAERLGVPVRTLQDWEYGRSQPRGLGRVALLERIRK